MIRKLYSNKPLLMTLICLYMALEFFIAGPYSYVKMFDVGDYHIPRNLTLSKTLWDVGPQFWYPYKMGGLDLFTTGYSYYSLNFASLLFHFIPGWMAYQLYVIAVFWVGGFFTYKLLKQELELSETACLLGGTLYTAILGIDFIDLARAVLPLTILLMLNGLRKKSLKLQLLAALPFSLSGLLVYEAMNVVILGVLLLFFLKDWKQAFRGTFIIGGMFFLLSFPGFMAMLLNGGDSHRAQVLPNLSEQFYELYKSVFLVHFYHYQLEGYLVWAGLAISALGLFFRNTKGFKFFMMMVVGIIGVICISNYFKSLVGEHLGLFKSVNFNYFMRCFHFCLTILAAIAFHQMSSKALKRLVLVGFASVFVYVTLVKKKHHWDNWRSGVDYIVTNGGDYYSTFNNKVLAKLGKDNEQEIFRTAVFDLPASWVEGYGFEVFGGYSSIYPKQFEDFFNLIEKRHTTNGNRAYLAANRHFRIDDFNYDLISYANTKYVISKFAIRDLGEPLNIPRRIVNGTRPRPIQERLRSRFNEFDHYIYQNHNYLPRFYLVDRVEGVPQGELLQKLKGVTLPQIQSTVYLTTEDAEELNGLREFEAYWYHKGLVNQSARTMAFNVEKPVSSDVPNQTANKVEFNPFPVSTLTYTPDVIELKVDARPRDVLVVSNSYSRYWRVWVDGEETKLYKANHAFWAVPLKSGVQKIRFEYLPPYKPSLSHFIDPGGDQIL